MKKNNAFGFILLLMVILLTACTSGNQTAAEPVALTVMTHDSYAVSEPIITAFETENNVKLVFLKSGDAGSALNRAILTKNNPQADVYYGVDNALLSLALKEEIFETYPSPLLSQIPDEFQLDPTFQALPVDYGDVCINYDKAYFTEHNLVVPQTLEELTDPQYQGLLVTENPATSSPGLAFLFTTIAHFGEDQYLNYWEALKNNGVIVVNDWETAYYTNFSGSSGKGAQPMVVSYATSPAAEVIFASEPLDESPTASIVGSQTCFRQTEFVGILKGTKQRALAEKFVDYMLSKTYQEDIPEQMFVYPTNENAVIPDSFIKYAQVPEDPATLAPALISENRAKWINDWTEAVLR